VSRRKNGRFRGGVVVEAVMQEHVSRNEIAPQFKEEDNSRGGFESLTPQGGHWHLIQIVLCQDWAIRYPVKDCVPSEILGMGSAK